MLAKDFSSGTSLAARVWRFPRRPWVEQRNSLLRRFFRWVPGLVLPIKLPFGCWWLGRYEYSTDMIITSAYEQAETTFLQRFLRPGMMVVDVGANRGYYSLLASVRVGKEGHVVAFEPSKRERRYLRGNLLLNRCRNVTVERSALGAAAGLGGLFIAEGYPTGCNCLRSRASEIPGHTEAAVVRTLDEYVRGARLRVIDFIKMDIEGGELDVLRGAVEVLSGHSRPIILCELIDRVTRLWGYEPLETIAFLNGLAYVWFSLLPDGSLASLPADQSSFDGNFVAVPREKLGNI